MAMHQQTRRPGRQKGDKPSPIDVHVGSRVRLRRNMLGLSQEKLGGAIGLTFQQVQKYERGANRIGASRLHDLSQVLDVPVSFFFDDMDPVRAPAIPQALPNPLPKPSTPTRCAGGRRSNWSAPITGSTIRPCAVACSNSPGPWPSEPNGLPAIRLVNQSARRRLIARAEEIGKSWLARELVLWNAANFANTDLTVSIIGLGCSGMSGAYGPADVAESVATIRRALDLGVNFLDTS